jgi:putative ABC transport system permease protein
MNWLTQLLRRLNYLARRKQMDADLAEEMRLHVEMRAAEVGDPAAARKQFGNETRLREKSRDAWGWSWLDSVGQDLRYGWRNLMSARGFTITAVLSLALGIGANTAIFSIVNALMLRSLPVPDPHRLVGINVGGNDHLTVPLWEAIRDHQNSFSGAFAYSSSRFDLAQEGEKRIVNGLWVSGNFFNVLGVTPERGRVFNREDDLHGVGKNGPVAVISHAFWQNQYGGAPDILGKTVKLDGHPFEIVGVTPKTFRGLEPDRLFNVAIPLGCEPMFHPDGSALTNRSWWWLQIGGRLAPGLTTAQAQERMKTVSSTIMEQTLPDWDEGGKAQYLKNTIGVKAVAGVSGAPREAKLMLFAMMGVVAMVLLIACANIANLLLARAAARAQEISVRLAIGAGRGRLIRQLLTESFLLAALGIPGGIFIAHWGSRFLARTAAPRGQALELDLSMDSHVLLFTVGIALLTGLIFGLAPALRATRISTNEVLKQTTRGSGNAGRFRLGRALVAGQVALSLTLLVAAGLFVTTLRNLWNVTLGFNSQNVLLINYDARGKVPKTQRAEHFAQIHERLLHVPGVVSAGATMITPISGMAWNGILLREGVPMPPPSEADRREMTYFNRVSPGFFETLRTPIRMGREFSDRDNLNGPRVMILGQKTARALFGDESPIGKRVQMGAGPGEPEMYEVVGVAPDSKYVRINEETRRIAYVAMTQDPNPREDRTFMVRTSTPNFDTIRPAIAAAVGEVAPGSSIEFRSLEHQVNNSLSQQRLIAGLVSFFGALALLLAIVGLYGVTAYAAAQRKGEIGIRMALGAQRGSVIWLVLRDVAIILALGSVLGIALSFGAGKLIGSLMFGVKPGDPNTLIFAALLLAIAGAIAGFIPAFRASKLDPAIALRYE